LAWHPVVDAALVTNEEAKGLTLNGHEIALCLVKGEYYAIGNICTHQHALLSHGFVDNGCIECPLHQGRFDIRTGEALGPPVTLPLETYPVKVEDGQVFVYVD
jgi:nitrite reductase/ring-hydroxylating ferredoxin subunit